MWCKIVNEDNTLKVSFCGFQVQLYIYFMLKFAMEILLSESSVVTAHYFQWSTRSVSLFLALLGLTVLPVNWIVGSYASNLFQDRYFYNLQIISSYANNDGNFKYVIDGSLMYLHLFSMNILGFRLKCGSFVLKMDSPSFFSGNC